MTFVAWVRVIGGGTLGASVSTATSSPCTVSLAVGSLARPQPDTMATATIAVTHPAHRTVTVVVITPPQPRPLLRRQFLEHPPVHQQEPVAFGREHVVLAPPAHDAD